MSGASPTMVSPSTLDYEAKNAVGRRVLRAHVDDHGLVFGWGVAAIAGGVSDDIFYAGVNRGDTGQFFDGGCH